MRELFGLINLFKPSGISSRRAVSILSERIRRTKFGHAGTLDPLAEGVLLVAVGRATRIVSFLHELPKQYLATFDLGLESPSQDTTTDCRQVFHRNVNREELIAACKAHCGEISQVPPAFSAVRVNGRRAYKLARAGAEVELQPRLVNVYDIQLISFSETHFQLLIDCGKGTYARTLGFDIAKSLGTTCVMSKLTRTRIGPFGVEESIEASDFISASWRNQLLNPTLAFPDWPQVVLSAEQIDGAENGFWPQLEAPEDNVLGVDGEGRLIALLRRAEGNRFRYTINFVPNGDN